MNFSVNKNSDATEVGITVEGSIDTVTAPVLDEELFKHFGCVKVLTLDFGAVDYVSSAGLRVIMKADQQIGDNGKLVLKNVNEDVREVFEMTGFDELLNIE